MDRAYEQARRELLEADPDWQRAEVRQLDRAYQRYLDAWRARSSARMRQPADRSDTQAARAREARNKARREKAAERRAAQRELRAALTAQGWPQGWPVELSQAWQRGGGTPDTAQLVDRAGWDHSSVKGVLNTIGDLSEITVPEGEARQHQRVGDSLAELVTGLWPPVPARTVMSVKALSRDGHRSRHLIIDQPGSRALRTFTQAQDCWSPTDTSLDPDTPLAQLTADHPELLTVPAGRSVDAWIDPDVLGATVIRDLVTLPGDEPEQEAGWPEDTAQQWAAEDEELEEAYPQLPWAHRWVRVNGDRVTGLRPTPHTGALAPVLANEFRGHYLDTGSLARYQWYSEGAMVSWHGTVELVDLGNGLLLQRIWGDDLVAPSVDPLPEHADALAVRLADWIRDLQTGPLAALELQQIDPAGTLSPADRARWNQALAAITKFGRVEFAVATDVLDALRARLTKSDEEYRRAAAGLADPTSPDGVALLAALEAAITHAATGDLQGGNW